jgi:Gpi18-like mannosyltransferase
LSHSRNLTRRPNRTVLYVLAAAFVAFALKLVVASNTFGTNDVVTFYQFAKSLHEHGLQWTYQHSISFNHPPLTAYYLRAIYYLDQLPLFRAYGLTFPFLIRLPGIVADLIVVLALLWVAKNDTRVRIPSWALLLFALSPVSLMITGFHGNTDPVMVMFLVLAAIATLRNKPLLAGLFLALSCQIKVVPLLLFPVLFFFWNARRTILSFFLPFAVTSALLWAEPLTKFPALFLHNVLSYGSFWGIWGITYWLRLTSLPQFSAVSFHNLPPWESLTIAVLKLLIIYAVLMIAWRRQHLNERALLDSLAHVWIFFFVFSPGVCTQYMIWLAPFVLILSPRFYAWLTATSTLFVFFFYNITAHGLPWYLAVSTNQLNTAWTPWTIWPWATLLIGMILLWKNAKRANPALRCFSLEPARLESYS